MSSLELKIPPPAVALVVALLMWGIHRLSISVEWSGVLRMYFVVVLAGIGVAVDLSALVGFRRAKTTINPTKPGKTSSVVTSGVYRVSRNPMYLGLAFMLTAWAIHLRSAWALLGTAIFVAYITRFQIVPEERVLIATFGEEFLAYMKKVRRWL